MPDTRRIVGGVCYAKADQVSKDAKRIYGAAISTKWLRGVVVEVLSHRNDGAKRSTTYIKAKYMVGNTEKQKILSLQSLKDKDPTATSPERNDATTLSPVVANHSGPPADGDITPTPPTPPMPDLTGGHGEANAVLAAATAPPPDEATNNTSRNASTSASQTPTATSHGRNWFGDRDTTVDMNGAAPRRIWKMFCQYTGREYTPGCDDKGDSVFDDSLNGNSGHNFTPYDFFMASFPKTQLKFMVDSTSAALRAEGRKATSMGEVLKFIGVCLLVTRFEFGTRASLWGMASNRKYMPAPAFGRTGMPRDCYEELMKYMVFSFQPPVRPQGTSSETYRWMLVQGFVDLFNAHRKNYFTPSSRITVDESISRWYGLGGNWINMGLPHYIAIDRKPEDGCEIQNAADGMSGIMMRLKLVKSPAGDKEAIEEQGASPDDNGYLHGCNILYDLVRPWAHTDAIVVADSYFASVQAAIRLKGIGLRFIGVVKTATKGYPMHYLGRAEMPGGRGDRLGLVSTDEQTGTDLLAFVWVDRDRRYFISTASSLAAGHPCVRKRWRQVDKTPNAPPVLKEVIVAQPEACGIYYSACGKIDQHNRHRQAALMLEKKIHTMKWDKRVNMSLLGIVIVDAYLLCMGCQPGVYWTPRDFVEILAEQLIDNKFEERALRKRTARAAGMDIGKPTAPGSVLDANEQLTSPTPTKRMKRSNLKHRAQGRCMSCSAQTVHVCRACQRKYPKTTDKQFWICNKAGKACMGIHIIKAHPDKNASSPETDKDFFPL